MARWNQNLVSCSQEYGQLELEYGKLQSWDVIELAEKLCIWFQRKKEVPTFLTFIQYSIFRYSLPRFSLEKDAPDRLVSLRADALEIIEPVSNKNILEVGNK